MQDIPNLGYLFYHQYFRHFQDENGRAVNWQQLSEMRDRKSEADKKRMEAIFKKKNDALTKPKLDGYTGQKHDFLSEKPEDGQVFYLKTTYPGLLIGSGYTHETNLQGEFKLGFFFDHTTGLPHIPGSSVKGVLRAAFRNWAGLVLEIWAKMRQGAPQADLEEMEKKWPHLNAEKLALLERDIFGTRVHPEDDLDNPMRQGRDIFYDAVPVRSSHPTTETQGNLLANDFITPHLNRKKPELSPFTDPTPIQFMKILPEVTFRFQFELTDGLISKDQKLELFKEILKNLGAGAKTNVGYGQFVPA